MIRNPNFALPLYLCALLVLTSCAKPLATTPATATHEPITQYLINILKEHPELESMLLRSIEMAKEINPDKKTNPAQSLEEYFAYLNWTIKAMPWNALPRVEQSFPFLFDAVDQSLNYFYWILDQPLPELEGKGLYFNSLQYVPELQPWLVRYAKSWGEFLSTEESWNSEYYALMQQEGRFNLDKGWYEDPSNWRTWNDFFSRALSSPDVRPIAAPHDDSVIISPADSEPQGVWQIDEDSSIVLGVQIKSTEFQSVPLLLDNSEYGQVFAGGVLTHTFLNVHDYHRFHFPVSGTIKEARIIAAQDAAGGRTVWDAAAGKYRLFSTEPGWQTIETRGLIIIETADYGLVAVLPVGMSQISSVVFEDTVVTGAEVKKGDPLGRFLFGGSDIVMIFEKAAGFKITVPVAGDVHEHVLMGQEYGRFRNSAD